MAAAISLHLERNPDHVDISCDARNAFNSLCRTQLWRTLLAHFPHFTKLVYGEVSDVILYEDGIGNSTITNSAGSRQGCCFGSFLYCLAIHPSLLRLREEFTDLLILAYFDDVQIVGPPGRAIQAYKRWAHWHGSVLQGELRDDKGKAFPLTISETELRSFGLPASMSTTSLGLRVLGALVGTIDFDCSFATEKINEISKDLDKLGRMPSHQAQLLVATKAVVHRINHLLRNTPGGELSRYSAKWQQLTTAHSFQLLVALPLPPSLPDVSQRICHLPPRKGGLGLRTWGSSADNAFLAAYTHAPQLLSYPLS